MDINLLKKLIKVVESSEITEFEVEEGDLYVRISKQNNSVQHVVSQPQVLPAAAPAAAPSVSSDSSSSEKPAETNANLYEIKSPIVGTFYRSPAPDADPYVSEGEQVSQGTVLCIVEAMKLLNEIESDVSGKIVKILVDDATPVEYNQPLFLVEKQ